MSIINNSADYFLNNDNVDLSKWNFFDFTPACVISKNLNNDSKLPNLFVIPDIKFESFYSNLDIIDSNTNLHTKYNKIYIMNWCYVSKCNDILCRYNYLWDNIDETKNEDNEKYKITFINNCALIIDFIINILKIHNVHLLGNCIGANIAIELIKKNNKYTGLFLSCPKSKFDVNLYSNFLSLGNRLKNIKMLFSWNIDHSNEHDKTFYDKMFYDLEHKLGSIKYSNKYYDYKFNNNIHYDFIHDIVN